MESRRALDSAGSSWGEFTLKDECPARIHNQMLKATYRRRRMQDCRKIPWLVIVIALLCCCLSVAAQTGTDENPEVQGVRKLAEEQRWQDIVLLLGPLHSRSADMDFYYGGALAHLERWAEAASAFEAGRRLFAEHPGVPIEIPGG